MIDPNVKIFAALVVHRDVPEEVFDSQKIAIVLSSIPPHITDDTVKLMIGDSIRRSGQNPDEYNLVRLLIKYRVGDMIRDIPLAPIVKPVEQPIPINILSPKENKEKNKDEIISYVRYVFGASGDKADQVVAENVIKKFKVKNV